MRPSLESIISVIIVFFLGAALGRGRTPDPRTVVDSVTVQELERRLGDAQIESEGWRARFEGVRVLPADTVYVTDTLVAIPDTVYEFVTIRDGTVSAGSLVRAEGEFATPGLTTTRYGNCDDGIMVSANGVVCDPAQFGHLELFAQLGTVDAELGLSWSPSFRSTWAVEFAWTGDRYELRIRKGLRLW